MTRIPYVALDDLEPRVRDVVERVEPINLIRVMAHAQGSLESIIRLSDSVLNRAKIDPIVRQLALIRLCVVIGSDYERVQLESVSAGYGMDKALIAQGRIGSTSTELTELQRMGCKLAEELAGSVRPSETTFQYFMEHLPVREFVELIQAIGFYAMQARMIETFDVSFEDPPIDLSGRMDKVDPEHLRKWRNGEA
ncbi:MAG: hypothetical protein AAF311_13730 [Pseudomonadota bacterium]